MRLLQGLVALHEKVDRISEQLETNAGKSLRDSVDRIETRVVAVDARTALMSAVQSAQIDGANYGIVFADLDGRLTRANRTFRRWVGKELPELLRDGWMQVIHPDDLFLVTSGWAEAVRRGIEYLPALPITYLDSEGDPFRAHVTARLIREDGKALFYWCEIWRVE
jgi:PAS domain-containing protein